MKICIFPRNLKIIFFYQYIFPKCQRTRNGIANFLRGHNQVLIMIWWTRRKYWNDVKFVRFCHMLPSPMQNLLWFLKLSTWEAEFFDVFFQYFFHIINCLVTFAQTAQNRKYFKYFFQTSTNSSPSTLNVSLEKLNQIQHEDLVCCISELLFVPCRQ